MNLDSKIYIAGHRGLVGSAIMRQLQAKGYNNLVTRTHAELDLEDAVATQRLFEQERPEIVFLAAAKVGGIHANNTYPVEFLMSNLGSKKLQMYQFLISHQVQRTSLRGAKRRGNPDAFKHKGLLIGWIAALRSQ